MKAKYAMHIDGEEKAIQNTPIKIADTHKQYKGKVRFSHVNRRTNPKRYTQEEVEEIIDYFFESCD